MSAYSDLLLSLGPSLYWPLDVTTGATDLSGNARNGTATGGLSIGGASEVPLNGYSTCTDFDGVDDAVGSTYNPFTNGTDRTFMGWAKRESSATGDQLFCGDAATLSPRVNLSASSTNLTFTPASGGTTTTFTSAWPGDNQWVCWCLLFTEGGDIVVLYINGTSAGAQVNATPYDAVPGNFQVGLVAGGFNPFDGKMAHVAVFHRFLAAGEIVMLYNAGFATDLSAAASNEPGPGLYGPGREDLALDVF